MIKPVRTTESDHVRGHRREIDTGKHPLSVNSHAFGDVVHSNTLPMRSTLVPNKNWKPPKPSRLGLSVPTTGRSSPFKIERRRADADELLDAVRHSPEVESPYGNRPTLKHPTFTSRHRRGDEEEE